jgi:glycosyltransferase involved in cell wall biosynthesis
MSLCSTWLRRRSVSALADWRSSVPVHPLRKSLIAAVHPLAAGVAQFNGALARAMAQHGPVDVISWRRLYPPLLYRGQVLDPSSPHPDGPEAAFILDWHDPRSWHRAARRVAEFDADVLILPWLHPVMTPPYRYLLRHVPRSTSRVVICHNVKPHEAVAGLRALSRATLRHAELIVTHAPHQRGEVAALGLASIPLLEAFHPRFAADDFGPVPTASERAAERARYGDPDLLLLAFGSIRPYKGIDIALDALARVDPSLYARLVVAGRSWDGGDALRAQAARLGLEGRVDFLDRFISNEEAALLFSAADASLLPYRSASQSGVVQLSFAYERPVIATRVGGLPAAVDDDVTGVLCEPDPDSVARAIERMADAHTELGDGVRATTHTTSFERYTALLDDAFVGLRS